MIQNFKSISTRKANRLRQAPSTPLWQRDYYEHIVRDQIDLERIQRYIAANPARWRM
jgi:REP element-mobilizing transposase RayT